MTKTSNSHRGGCAAPSLSLAGDLSSSCSAIVINPDATPGVAPAGPLCCAAHRAATRLAPAGSGR
ncbi:TPA: hypothetical protein L2Q75_004228 [Escherichia coli O25b:H4-ST131]|nr:hypothetical protein [Escherichia coli]HBN4411170.1 hypothetical protein [Escherichia coli O25b:H4-ST131]